MPAYTPGLVDLLSILPTYIALLIPGAQYLLILRVLRLLRIFRILKLARYMSEASVLITVLRASVAKITVFLAVVVTMVVIIGTLMYVIEGPRSGFTSIPTSIYWAIVTLTTVGYSDITPKTPVGKGLASLAMILGYRIIAVPTGIVTVGLAQAQAGRASALSCSRCGLERHEADARYCRRCGQTLPNAPLHLPHPELVWQKQQPEPVQRWGIGESCTGDVRSEVLVLNRTFIRASPDEFQHFRSSDRGFAWCYSWGEPCMKVLYRRTGQWVPVVQFLPFVGTCYSMCLG